MAQNEEGQVIDPGVREKLESLERGDSYLRGTIVDIGTINPLDPLGNFDVEHREIITESKNLIKTLVKTDRHRHCIAVAVRLPCEDIFIDLFTYEDSSTSDYPLIGTLAQALDVDNASVHHIVGKEVTIVREDSRWIISEKHVTPTSEPTVRWRSFLTPLAISGLLIPGGGLLGYVTPVDIPPGYLNPGEILPEYLKPGEILPEYLNPVGQDPRVERAPGEILPEFLRPGELLSEYLPLGELLQGFNIGILPAIIVGTAAAVICYGFVLYLLMATKRDHSLPSRLQNYLVPDYTDDAGEVEPNSGVKDVENGEFVELVTLTDSETGKNTRTVMRNTCVVVNIPPAGNVLVPVPTPTGAWHGTRIKRLVYQLSPSVNELDRTRGDLVPLRIRNGRVEIDPDRLPEDVQRERRLPERVADAYVTTINSMLGIPTRSDIFP